MHLGDDGGSHVIDEIQISNAPHISRSANLPLQSSVLVGDTSAHREDDVVARDVHFTPRSSHPSFQLLSPSDFQWPPRQEQEQPVDQHQPQQPLHNEETVTVEHTPPLSYPTFQLLSSTDF